VKKDKKKHQELSKEELFQFLIGDPAYPGGDVDYKNGLKIYKCSVIKKGQVPCYECAKFPCGKYDDIKESISNQGYKLIKYQKSLKKAGKEK
jgi:hypothetical protein